MARELKMRKMTNGKWNLHFNVEYATKFELTIQKDANKRSAKISRISRLSYSTNTHTEQLNDHSLP